MPILRRTALRLPGKTGLICGDMHWAHAESGEPVASLHDFHQLAACTDTLPEPAPDAGLLSRRRVHAGGVRGRGLHR